MSILGAFVLPHPPLILPEVGQGKEIEIQKTIDAYREASRRVAALKPDTIVLVTPHSVLYADYFHISPGRRAEGDLRRFSPRAPGVKVTYDTDFVSALSQNASQANLPAGTQGERDAKLDHATVIPLRFVEESYQSHQLVRIGVSGFPLSDHYRLGQSVARTSEQLSRKTVLIASADLSHHLKSDGPYDFAPEGPAFDKQITAAMASGDFSRFLQFPPDFSEKAGECGLRPCVVLAGALDRREVRAELLSYEGPFGVGYAVAAFAPAGQSEERAFLDRFLVEEQTRMKAIKAKEDPYVRLARHALESYIQSGKTAKAPPDLPADMTARRAGVFVSLKKHGELRGCIGTIAPGSDNIAAEICRNAVSAAAEDPRFDPVRPDELDQLVYSVDVLDAPEPIDSPDMLDVSRYGVIVTSGRKRGLLLPNLDGVDTVARQVDIAKQKAGIKPGESYQLERFEVTRHT